MRIEQLNYLLAIQKNKSMTAAAENLHIAQQSISVAIKQLEEEVGTQLVERTPKGSVLTPAGKEIAQYATEIMRRWDIIVKKYHSSSIGKQKMDISLFLSPIFSINPLVANFISYCTKENPQLDININYCSNDEIAKLIRKTNNSIGMFMLRENRLKNLSNCHKIIMDTHYVTVWCSQNSPVLNNGKFSLKKLRDQKIICIGRNNKNDNPLVEIIDEYELAKYNHVTYNMPNTIIEEYIKNGYGVVLGLYSKSNIAHSSTNIGIKLFAEEKIKFYSIAITTSDIIYSTFINILKKLQ